MDPDFMIDDETASKLAELIIRRLANSNDAYSFVLSGKIIRLTSYIKNSTGMFGIENWDYKIIEFNTLKSILSKFSLMEIKNAIEKAEYYHYSSENHVSDQIHLYESHNYVVKYLDDKITEIRFKKLSRENAELKESIKQLSDMFMGLVNVMEMNKGI